MWDRNLFDIVYFDIVPHEVGEFALQREQAIFKLEELLAEKHIHPNDYNLEKLSRPYIFTTKELCDWVHRYNERILTSSSTLTDPDFVISYDGSGNVQLDYLGSSSGFTFISLIFYDDGLLEIVHHKENSKMKAQYLDFRNNYLNPKYLDEIKNLLFKVSLL